VISYIKTALFEPKNSYIAKNMKGKHLFLYYAFLVLLLTFSFVGEIAPLFQSLQSDGQEVAQAIPEFQIEEGRLQSEEESFVYQTNSLLFFFDTEGNIEPESVNQNVRRLPASIAIGLLEEELVFNFDGVSRSFSYGQMERIAPLSPQTLRTILSELGVFSPIMMFILFISIYIAVFINAAMEFLILALFANIIATLLRSTLRFFATTRIVLLSSTLPILAFTVANIIQLHTPYQYELRMIFSLFLFGLTINEMKKKQRDELEKRKQEDQNRD
jgi:hypothetical protein